MVDHVKLSALFYIEYGNQLDKNKLTESKSGINFVSRTSLNLGVDTKVEKIEGIEPYEAGLITATLGGTYLLSSFIQPEPFYTAQNIKVLRPLIPMSFNEKAFYCLAIAHNRFRYTSHGREANKTFDDILVPAFESIPNWVSSNDYYEKMWDRVPQFPSSLGNFSNDEIGKKRVKLSDLFDVIYGHSLELNSLIKCKDGINFVSRTSGNNGVSARVKPIEGIEPIEAGVLTVAGGGSVLETFLQTQPFYSGRDLYYLQPKVEMTIEQKLFFCLCIRENKFRYNYGRQANKTLPDLLIPAISEIPVWVSEGYGDLLANWLVRRKT